MAAAACSPQRTASRRSAGGGHQVGRGAGRELPAISDQSRSAADRAVVAGANPARFCAGTNPTPQISGSARRRLHQHQRVVRGGPPPPPPWHACCRGRRPTDSAACLSASQRIELNASHANTYEHASTMDHTHRAAVRLGDAWSRDRNKNNSGAGGWAGSRCLPQAASCPAQQPEGRPSEHPDFEQCCPMPLPATCGVNTGC